MNPLVPGLSVCVASSGRPTLARTLASVVDQLRPGDELLVDVNRDSPWGHRARNRMMPKARCTGLVFIDDDDEYFDGGLEAMRRAHLADPGVHIFKMEYLDGRRLWIDRRVCLGNISTQMFCVPNLWADLDDQRLRHLPKWGDRYEGDFDFISSMCHLIGGPKWHKEVVALYGRAGA